MTVHTDSSTSDLFVWFGAAALRSTILQFAILSGCPMAASQVRRLHSIYVHISDFSFILTKQAGKKQENGFANDSRVSVKSDILLTIVLTINKLSSFKILSTAEAHCVKKGRWAC